jgi:cell division septation protein DedD
MRYRLSLGRGEAAMVLGGAVLVGVLLFCVGLMTGIAVERGRAAPHADAVMVAAPEEIDPAPPSAPAEEAAAEAGTAEEGAPVQPTTMAEPDGVGGPRPEDAAVVAAADGWSVPEGYAAPRGSATRWAALPPLDGADAPAGAPIDTPEDAVPAIAPRSRPAIREPAPPAEPEPSLTPRPGGTRFGAYDGGGAPYALEVGRFRGEEAAVKVMESLNARGHQAYIYTVVERGAPVFSVRMHRYVDRQTAMRAAERLETRERLAALVVPTEQR